MPGSTEPGSPLHLTRNHGLMQTRATGVVGKGFGKAKGKVTRNKGAPADEDPTDENAILIHQEPDDQSKEKHRGEKVSLAHISPAKQSMQSQALLPQ